MSREPSAQDLAAFAEAVLAALKLYPEVTYHGRTFKRSTVGMCSRFVRMCVEGVQDLPDQALGGKLFGAHAVETERLLQAAGKRTDTPVRGDIVCFNRNAGPPGHIGIYLGDGKFAENTSSRTRGPGTVISSLSLMGGRVSGYYQVLRHAAFVGLRVLLEGEIVDCRPLLEDDRVRCNLRELAEALGYEVQADLSQSRITLKKR